jgi:hypothetical protein
VKIGPGQLIPSPRALFRRRPRHRRLTGQLIPSPRASFRRWPRHRWYG